jgi:CheY-like chemotaxis protein
MAPAPRHKRIPERCSSLVIHSAFRYPRSSNVALRAARRIQHAQGRSGIPAMGTQRPGSPSHSLVACQTNHHQIHGLTNVWRATSGLARRATCSSGPCRPKRCQFSPPRGAHRLTAAVPQGIRVVEIRASIINYADSIITKTGDERNPRMHHTVYRMAQPKPTTSTSRVLVADTEPQVRKLLVGKLKSAGYTVGEAGSGRKTLDILRGTCFHVLVLDLDMPGAGGFEVLKAVRSEMPHLRVLVISVTRELLDAAEWFGAVAAIDKGSAPAQLVKTVRRLIGNR